MQQIKTIRKNQAQKAFELFCGDLLMIDKRPDVFGGKNAIVNFQLYGTWYSFYPLEGVARKGEARRVHLFKTARELFDFANAHDEMQRNDPNFKF